MALAVGSGGTRVGDGRAVGVETGAVVAVGAGCSVAGGAGAGAFVNAVDVTLVTVGWAARAELMSDPQATIVNARMLAKNRVER